ncbi:hypothetical protein SRDD_08600 [Serratia sp. DD3]|nr:hypothetical protein SRDD_08600 [Serratia sp. DD3]
MVNHRGGDSCITPVVKLDNGSRAKPGEWVVRANLYTKVRDPQHILPGNIQVNFGTIINNKIIGGIICVDGVISRPIG